MAGELLAIIYCIVLIATDKKDNDKEDIIKNNVDMEEKYEFA